jgi:hypothetical protein
MWEVRMLHNADHPTPWEQMLMKTALALACALLLATTVQAQTGESRCVTDFRAEQARIEREAMARAPAPGSDQATQQRFMQGVHTQLKAAADRAEACEAASRPQPGSPAARPRRRPSHAISSARKRRHGSSTRSSCRTSPASSSNVPTVRRRPASWTA